MRKKLMYLSVSNERNAPGAHVATYEKKGWQAKGKRFETVAAMRGAAKENGQRVFRVSPF